MKKVESVKKGILTSFWVCSAPKSWSKYTTNAAIYSCNWTISALWDLNLRFLKFSNPDPPGQVGQCVKGSLVQNDTVWTVTNCLDVTGKGYVCQRRQNFEDIGE